MEVDLATNTTIKAGLLVAGACFQDDIGRVQMVLDISGEYNINPEYPVATVNLQSGHVFKYKADAEVTELNLKVVSQ